MWRAMMCAAAQDHPIDVHVLQLGAGHAEGSVADGSLPHSLAPSAMVTKPAGHSKHGPLTLPGL